MISSEELKRKLSEIMALPAEVEWVEFKEAKPTIHFDDLGKYFSALSNEASLKGQECAWLVFGVTDKPPRKIIGSQYRPDRPALDKLKQEIAEQTNNQLTFIEIYELHHELHHEPHHPEGRVLMFQIPPALRGIPTAWKGHYYGRNGESLGPLNLSEIDRIRGQAVREDWQMHRKYQDHHQSYQPCHPASRVILPFGGGHIDVSCFPDFPRPAERRTDVYRGQRAWKGVQRKSFCLVP